MYGYEKLEGLYFSEASFLYQGEMKHPPKAGKIVHYIGQFGHDHPAFLIELLNSSVQGAHQVVVSPGVPKWTFFSDEKRLRIYLEKNDH